MKRMKIPGWGQCASVRGGHGDVPAHSSPSRARWLGMRMLVLTLLLSMIGAQGAWADSNTEVTFNGANMTVGWVKATLGGYSQFGGEITAPSGGLNASVKFEITSGHDSYYIKNVYLRESQASDITSRWTNRSHDGFDETIYGDKDEAPVSVNSQKNRIFEYAPTGNTYPSEFNISYTIPATKGTKITAFVVLGIKPLDGPGQLHWNLVSNNTQYNNEQAINDYYSVSASTNFPVQWNTTTQNQEGISFTHGSGSEGYLKMSIVGSGKMHVKYARIGDPTVWSSNSGTTGSINGANYMVLSKTNVGAGSILKIDGNISSNASYYAVMLKMGTGNNSDDEVAVSGAYPTTFEASGAIPSITITSDMMKTILANSDKELRLYYWGLTPSAVTSEMHISLSTNASFVYDNQQPHNVTEKTQYEVGTESHTMYVGDPRTIYIGATPGIDIKSVTWEPDDNWKPVVTLSPSTMTLLMGTTGDLPTYTIQHGGDNPTMTWSVAKHSGDNGNIGIEVTDNNTKVKANAVTPEGKPNYINLKLTYGDDTKEYWSSATAVTVIDEPELVAVSAASYIFEGERFGASGTTYSSKTTVVNNNKLKIVNGQVGNTSTMGGAATVTAEGLRWRDTSAKSNQLIFKVPCAGTIYVNGIWHDGDSRSFTLAGNIGSTGYVSKKPNARGAFDFSGTYSGSIEQEITLTCNYCDVTITRITFVPALSNLSEHGSWDAANLTVLQAGETKTWDGHTESWSGGNVEHKEVLVAGGNLIRMTADDEHPIATGNNGFTFGGTGRSGEVFAGYLMFRATVPGTVKVTAIGKGTGEDVRQVSDSREVDINSNWAAGKMISASDIQNVTVTENTYLRVMVKKYGTSSDGNYGICFKPYWDENFSFGRPNGEAFFDVTSVIGDSYVAYDCKLTQRVLNEAINKGYLNVTGHDITVGNLFIVEKGQATESLISLSGGKEPKNRWASVKGGESEHSMTFFDRDNTRIIFVGATEGTRIKSIEWTPAQVTDADHDQLVAVTSQTTWSSGNNYGGFAYKADGVNNTNIEANIINPGNGVVRENTLYIYGGIPRDPTEGQSMFSKNGILSTAASPKNKSVTQAGVTKNSWDHIVEFKVMGRGVVKVTAAGNGPSGRTVKISRGPLSEGADLDNSMIIEEKPVHSSAASNGNNYGYSTNDEEHVGEFIRHQHDSAHDFYAYFDGSNMPDDGKGQSIFVYGRGGINITELTWFPDKDIAEVAGGHLNPVGDLSICDENGDVKVNGGALAVPEVIKINANDMAESVGLYQPLYDFHATVSSIAGFDVSVANKVPVWTSSQLGWGDDTRITNILDCVHDKHTQFINPNANPLVSEAYRVKPAKRTVTDWGNLSGTGSDVRDGWGIAYVVAGTLEGNRSDVRRVEVAGPATGIEVPNMTIGNDGKYHIKAVSGKPITLTVHPYLNYFDVGKSEVVNKMDRIKVEDPQSTTWTQGTVPNGLNIASVTTATSYADDLCAYKFTPTLSGNSQQSIEITASIVGVEEGLVNNSFKAKKHEVTFVVDVAPEGIFLTRVTPKKEIVNGEDFPQDVPVTSLIVFKVDASTVEFNDGDDAKLPIVVSNFIDVMGTVKKITTNGITETYIVYDVVGALKGMWGGAANFEHMNYEEEQNIVFSPSTTASANNNGWHNYAADNYVYLNGHNESTEAENHKAYNFRFKTESDPLGTDLETFVYNVSQRDNDEITVDINNNMLLYNHRVSKDNNADYAKYGITTESWYCNRRSQIKFSGIAAPESSEYVDGRITYLIANNNSKITISPCNYRLGDDEIKEKIKSIEINFNPTKTAQINDAANIVKFRKKTGEDFGDWTVKNQKLNGENGYTVIYEPANNPNNLLEGTFREAEIEFLQNNLYIDQIKINYYSAHRAPEPKTIDFALDYPSLDNFTRDLKGGMTFAGTDDNLKLVFKQDNMRHFALLQTFDRDGNNEKTSLTANGTRAMIIRDDKTEPCEMYFYTDDLNAEITKIEFICENDEEHNNISPLNLFCTSDPRFNPVEEAYHLVGLPFEKITANVGEAGCYKLVYTPESPTNFVAATLDANETGFLFVKKINVYLCENSQANKYILRTPNGTKATFNNGLINSVKLATNGIRITLPDNYDATKFLIKRTSAQNNLSAEVVLDVSDITPADFGYQAVLNDRDLNVETSFKHQKFYTVRILNDDRMIVRQLSFHTEENETPKIYCEYDNQYVLNEELRSAEVLETTHPNIYIETTKAADGHAPENTLIIYTTDGSAPYVVFDAETGRKVELIHGNLGVGMVSFNHDRSYRTSTGSTVNVNGITLNMASNDIEHSVVIKAIALPLTGAAPTSVTSLYDYDITAATNSSVISAINAVGSYGETSSITRGNYVYADPAKSFVTSAHRKSNGDYAIDLKGTGADSYRIGSVNDLISSDGQPVTSTDDKFHGAYRPMNEGAGSTHPEIFTYGGYEVWKNGAWKRDYIKNDYWQVKGNDLTPYRGLSGVVGGDTYVMSNITPLNENAGYVNKATEGGNLLSKGGRIVNTAQFDFTHHRTLADNNGTSKSYLRTWNLPCYGDYFMYEPTQKGTLTVYVKQQGVLDQQNNGMLDDQLLRFRPVYILDEAGNTPAGIKATTESKVSGDYMTVRHTTTGRSKYLDGTATDYLKAMCNAWVEDNTADENGNIEFGDRAYNTQGVIVMHDNISSETIYDGYKYSTTMLAARNNLLGSYTDPADDTNTIDGHAADVDGSNNTLRNGFMLISEGYVKYEFPVDAGKTYFVFAANGTLGFCSYTFKADEMYDAQGYKNTQLTLPLTDAGGAELTASAAQTKLEDEYVGKVCDVTLNRTFTGNTWTALVLPFSISIHKLQEKLGKGVHVSHFEIMGSDHLNTKRHIHQMIVAGVPVFVRTETTVSNPIFENVTIEKSTVEEVTEQGTDGKKYVCVGSYGKAQFGNNTWYINKDGKFAIRGKGTTNVSGTRCWIVPTDQNSIVDANAVKAYYRNLGAGFDENGEATDIEDVVVIDDDMSGSDMNVYDASGRIVRAGTTSLQGLPTGVYFINGEKHFVK